MANINIKNFVDINIKKHKELQSYGIRNTIVLYTNDTQATTSGTEINASDNVTKYSEITKKYLQMYFDNGGVKVLLKKIASIEAIENDMKLLDDDYICVAYTLNNTSDYTALKTVAGNRANDNSIRGTNEKLILASTTNFSEVANTKNFVVKYSTVAGAEMTIAAYLSKIDTYKANSVNDYMFTIEKITAEDIDNVTYVGIINNHMNVDILLSNEVRNCGGDCSDGEDLVDTYVRIILQQTVSNAVLQTLSEKLVGQNGLNKIYSAMSNELEKYKTCGYLTTDKVWTDQNLEITYPEDSNESWLIIEQGTAIQNGYYIKILPYAAISDSDRVAHKTPPIYLIIAEQSGIRKITINGDAI